MKGLIWKDFYCLRKQIQLFVIVTFGVIVLSIAFVLSYQYGNVALAAKEIQKEMQGEFFNQMFRMPIGIALLIPIAFTGSVVECFREDKKAGFKKVVLSMPVSNMEIVGSRFFACFLFAGVGVAGATLGAGLICLAMPEMKFVNLINIAITFCGILLIYMSVVLFLLYCLGAEHIDIIQLLPIMAVAVPALIIWVPKIMKMEDKAFTAFLLKMFSSINKFVSEQYRIVFLIGILCMIVSYFGSVKIYSKRKGV